jgi:hypothetical protein
LHNLALFWVKNANFFADFFGENIFKIITSVPDWATFRLLGHCLRSVYTKHEFNVVRPNLCSTTKIEVLQLCNFLCKNTESPHFWDSFSTEYLS